MSENENEEAVVETADATLPNDEELLVSTEFPPDEFEPLPQTPVDLGAEVIDDDETVGA